MHVWVALNISVDAPGVGKYWYDRQLDVRGAIACCLAVGTHGPRCNILVPIPSLYKGNPAMTHRDRPSWRWTCSGLRTSQYQPKN